MRPALMMGLRRFSMGGIIIAWACRLPVLWPVQQRCTAALWEWARCSQPKALAKAGLTINDMDVIEINEAFTRRHWPAFERLALLMTRRMLIRWRGDCAWPSARHVGGAVGADSGL